MVKPVRVRNTVIGPGKPKIIIPITGRTAEEITGTARPFKDCAPDMAEWRADFYDDVFNEKELLTTLKRLRAALGEEIPLLFTFRTASEGGEKSIGNGAYTALNKAVADSGFVDLVDVQVFLGDDIAGENIANIHAAGCLVVGSRHDFHATPEKEEMVRGLVKTAELGADIAKLAVMPRKRADVLALLSATAEAAERLECPLITMSMGPLGTITRLSGEVFGSSMTFGKIGAASAPGQIPIEQLRQALDIVHGSLHPEKDGI